MSFRYDQQVPVIFGAGAIQELGEHVKALGCQKVMCVYDAGVKAAGISVKAEESLRAAGVPFLVFDKVTADPTTTLVNEGGAIARKEGVDCLVGVGGGSSMDCAKGIALLCGYEPPIDNYLTSPPSTYKATVPIFLVPTTSGTGSESTQVAVITNEAHQKPAVYIDSTLAIVDPELTLTVPKSVTANTGMDAFTHACEAITARGWNPKSECLACAAIRKIAKYLPIAYDDGSNLEARSELCLASNWAGIAFADTDIHLGHALADSFSTTFHTPHGLNCAWGNPELMAFIAPTVPDKVKLIGEALGVVFTGSETPEEIGKMTADATRALMRRIGIKSPKEMGFSREDVVKGAALIMVNGVRFNCPVQITEADAAELLGRIYDTYQ